MNISPLDRRGPFTIPCYQELSRKLAFAQPNTHASAFNLDESFCCLGFTDANNAGLGSP
jgi:hypothetical protein